jgi:tRNA-uridine 2-sulfurtransferase
VGTKAHAYASFVEARSDGRVRPGAIVDGGGYVVGEHAGIHHFTIGQRKGLGVSGAEPVYVTRIDVATGNVHLGGADELLAHSATLEDCVLAPSVEVPCAARVRIRYRHEGVRARLVASSNRSPSTDLRVIFDEPVRAVTRGQIAVFYDEDRVLGGGRISCVSPS